MGKASGTPEVPYQVVFSTPSGVEVRSYGARVVAETLMRTKDPLTEGSGFRALAGYIFGGNDEKQQYAMTAPVETHATMCGDGANGGPVSQSLLSNEAVMRFTLPHNVSIDSIAKPNDKQVTVTKVNPQLFAVLRFSGGIQEGIFNAKAEELRDEIVQHMKYKIVNEIPISWRYNPPWTLSCFRRNEVAYEVVQAEDNAVAPGTRM